MAQQGTAGSRFREALEAERPLQIAGTINAYCTLLAERAGFRAIYLSGAGVANASHGLPDLGMTTREDVAEDARRITAATQLPLLVDADTGWSDDPPGEGMARTVAALIDAGVAGMHLEDQVDAKRCGHRPGKVLVSAAQMAERLDAAVRARDDDSFVIMARTDAAAVEGLDAAIDRARCYVQAGADMIFAEALTSLEQYKRFTDAVPAPVLANVTEFGKTPLLTVAELREAGVAMALYPLSAFRAMSRAAQRVYETLRTQGTQKELLPMMQSRDELYEVLDYASYETQLDETLKQEQHDGR